MKITGIPHRCTVSFLLVFFVGEFVRPETWVGVEFSALRLPVVTDGNAMHTMNAARVPLTRCTCQTRSRRGIAVGSAPGGLGKPRL
ncbi:uncharacterized protein B0T15DRAFT_531511 [Chaetomium strumarium]|uniref:Secreted protein n=1 Tax=Chaetomium strumarium TaxID=1170767 RepID=A0AAJ0M146_9PEZI|nr:hypothetical protein B0T15DRAFT_531511 [Chaetomium strumarium]